MFVSPAHSTPISTKCSIINSSLGSRNNTQYMVFTFATGPVHTLHDLVSLSPPARHESTWFRLVCVLGRCGWSMLWTISRACTPPVCRGTHWATRSERSPRQPTQESCTTRTVGHCRSRTAPSDQRRNHIRK
jgi:hypothetical protein